ncbi:hypothetical protein CBM2615_B140123 [Cupriavidus taiwanensis]|uniref:Uncharacterized protein n=1 Tax=Cupriavidus taiwanensis TaxID=164546 RepID=A0A375E7B7_9BURK|nr:hypothetical protein CBM2614_B150065 [Cupriavidus taiwanensis]SOZ64220.1 hypothetical protein CBM2615_B140123 [Cupriavidus taiwanensis]SOZ67987.1 hypothetical protein CBM2613_B110123 [Cupriavidus taiwanensis]SPA07848.1 hypothetical protein CBM2625_B110123 [Cupriavidus taiwanensis]
MDLSSAWTVDAGGLCLGLFEDRFAGFSELRSRGMRRNACYCQTRTGGSGLMKSYWS